MAINMTEDQLNRLIQAIRPQDQGNVGGGGAAQRQGAAGAAAVVGQMPGCQLGRNKITRFKKWNDWLRDAESKMRFLSITEGAQKVDFLRSCAGGELIEFWSKEVRIRFEDIPANQATGAAA